jgi:hypothetical protein
VPDATWVKVLTIDVDALQRRLQRKFSGNISAVAVAWPYDFQAPHRSTILRWFKGQTLPRTEQHLLCLAAALDLDPLALWHLVPERFPVLCARVLEAVASDDWGHLMYGLSFLARFVLPSRNWPPNVLARKYYGKKWVLAEFSYDAIDHRSYFEPLLVESLAPIQGDQSWHFAWRPTAESAWRPYGFVRLREKEVLLFSFSGESSRATVLDGSSFFVETWVGPGAAQFRIASMHDFRLRVAAPNPECLPAVRFA